MESVGPQLPKSYDADGVLTESVVFPGNAVTPKRWAVHDPDTNRVTAYVQCSSGDVKLDNYVGQHVGITGSMKYERNLKLYIVEAKDVTVLKADAKLPAPPEPTVKPPPKDQPPVDATPRPEAPKAEQAQDDADDGSGSQGNSNTQAGSGRTRLARHGRARRARCDSQGAGQGLGDAHHRTGHEACRLKGTAADGVEDGR